MRRSDSISSARIVIPVVAGIGNALLAVPMVRALKRVRPDAQITILARSGPIAEVFQRLTEVDETILTGGGLAGISRMIRAARARRADLYLVPFPSNRWQYSMLAATSGARRRILHGYPIGYWRAMHFIGDRVPAQRGLHDVEQNLRLVEACFSGAEPKHRSAGTLSDRSADDLNNRFAEADPAAPVFALNDGDRAAATALLGAAGFAPDQRRIVIHAGSAQTILASAKRWPVERYARLIETIEQRELGRICLIEGPDEAGVTDAIFKAREALGSPTHARAVRLAGSLGTAGALLETARLYVGSDSGLAHLAAAVGTPAVTLFAPADPQRVCPWGWRHLVVQAPTPCAPCFQYPWNATHPCMKCRPPLCIATITVEMVVAAIDRALGTSMASARSVPMSEDVPALRGSS